MNDERKKPIVLMPGAGRSYPMGKSLSVVFKADRDETDNRYSISEWWLESHTEGPGAPTCMRTRTVSSTSSRERRA